VPVKHCSSRTFLTDEGANLGLNLRTTRARAASDDAMRTCPSATPCRDLTLPCAGAARRGHLDCLKRAREEDGAAWDALVTRCAARAGHLDCLKYAHENGCPWDAGACEDAARRGKLECLRYLHENGCPWNRWAYRAVTAGGHAGCLEYLRRHGCPGGDEVRGGLFSDTLRSCTRTGRIDESDIERIREELDGIDVERLERELTESRLPDASLEATAEENAPPSSIEDVAARLCDEQLGANDARLKPVNEMLSEHFKRLSEATGESAYGAVSLMIDEYAAVVGQQIERGADISSQRTDRPEFWIHVADLIDDVIRRRRRRGWL